MTRVLRAVITGIVNVTPDSFSDGGNFLTPSQAAVHAGALLRAGADVIEFGGESTRPGALPVGGDEERRRVLPAIRAVAAQYPDLRIAVDTVKAEVAREAVERGASIVNDVSALRLDPELAHVCAGSGCMLILMHSRGTIADMASYAHATYPVGGVMDAVVAELERAVERALGAGVEPSRIVLDPGLGFSKTPEQSAEALAHLPQLVRLGFPVMVGTSRKRFIADLAGDTLPPEARDEGTVGANVAALMLGATWFRVHRPHPNRRALDVAARILEGVA